PRAELVRRLLEHEHFREAADLLEGAERERARYHARGYVEPRPAPRLAEAPLESTWEDVWGAVLAMAERLREPEPTYQVRGRLVRMEDKIEYVLQILARAHRVEFGALVAPWGTRMHAVVSLLACLELCKRDGLRLRQAAPFAPLWVYRRVEEAD